MVLKVEYFLLFVYKCFMFLLGIVLCALFISDEGSVWLLWDRVITLLSSQSSDFLILSFKGYGFNFRGMGWAQETLQWFFFSAFLHILFPPSLYIVSAFIFWLGCAS